MRKRISGLAFFACLLAAASAASAPAAHAAAPDCPPGGVVHLGMVPGEDTAQLIPIYNDIGKLIAARLGCPVRVQTGNNYTAVIEAMRAGRIEIGEFGAFSYVLAHQVAGAEAVATFANRQGKPGTYFATITTWPGSGIHSLQDVKGKPFAFADPASTSGHLIPSYGLEKAGIDPNRDIRPFYTGSHTASFEALLNHKVPVGELNSIAIAGAQAAGLYNPADFITLWKSAPIPNGPFAVRSDLPPEFKARLTVILQTLDLRSMPAKDMAFMGKQGVPGLVAINDQAYDPIRDVVTVLHLNLATMGN